MPEEKKTAKPASTTRNPRAKAAATEPKNPRTGKTAKSVKAKAEASDTPKRRVGRPRKGDVPLAVNLQVRVSQEVADACKNLGGPDFLRPVIEAAVAEGTALCQEDEIRDIARKAGRRHVPAIYRPSANDTSITFVDMGAQCGFPSPAFDYATQELSLNDYFFRHPDATYIVQAAGDSMIDAGIQEGDILMIDRSIEPKTGDIVLAVLNGEFTVKRLKVVGGKPELHPENAAADYPVIRPNEFDAFQIEGVLVGSGRKYRR